MRYRKNLKSRYTVSRKEIISYVQQGEPSREVQYIGSTINRILNIEDAALMMLTSITYFGFINEHFFEALKKAWGLEQ
jgi:hypothetical protein